MFKAKVIRNMFAKGVFRKVGEIIDVSQKDFEAYNSREQFLQRISEKKEGAETAPDFQNIISKEEKIEKIEIKEKKVNNNKKEKL
jgi:PDZ domain-containing secreted protein